MLQKSQSRFWLTFVLLSAVFFCSSQSVFSFNNGNGRNIPFETWLINCKWSDGTPYQLTCDQQDPCKCFADPGKVIHHNRFTQSFSASKTDRRNHLVIPRAKAEETYNFTNTLAGEWEDVVGYVGFQFTNQSENKDYIACLIGLPVESLGNGQYKSEGWDKKVFWLEVGDGAPMPVCAIFAPNYEEEGVKYDNVYWSPNFQYLAPGVQDKKQARPCELWMFLNEDDEVEEVWVDVFDLNWELTKSKQLGLGDQLRAFTPLIDTSEAGSFFATSLEDRFQTVKQTPLFLYEHMTPNVDFVNKDTEGFDFENVDLLYILYGENWNEDEVQQFAFSTPKNVNLKWGNAKPAKVENWFQHEMSALMNFFLPK